jgi:hypothetical protein
VPAFLFTGRAWLRRAWPLLLFLAYSTLVYLPVTVRMAYLVPAAPFLFMLATYGAVQMLKYRLRPVEQMR